jgi:replicative DNA helicase
MVFQQKPNTFQNTNQVQAAGAYQPGFQNTPQASFNQSGFQGVPQGGFQGAGQATRQGGFQGTTSNTFQGTSSSSPQAGFQGSTPYQPVAPNEQLVRQSQLPQNIEAEQSVLAACMLNGEITEEVVLRLRPENFFRPAHALIFEAIMSLTNRQIPVDPISLADTLKAMGQLEAVGGRPYIAELAGNTFALTSWERHVDIVKRQSILRELVFAAAKINSLAYDAPDDVNEVVEEAEKTLFDVTEKRVSSTFRNMSDLVSEAYAEITRLSQQKDHMAGVPTGFKDVDDLFHGFRGGDLVILAARPGVGKTSFALNLATNAAKAGTAVAFFSLEMGAEQLVQRILCSEARVSLSKLRSGYIAEGDWGALAEASGSLSQLDMFIDDTPGLSVLEARAKGRRELHHLKEGQKGLIVVDYLQLMQPGAATAHKSTNDQVSEISRGLKILAKEMNMPVIALSQLSRAVEQRGKDKRPMLSDLRDSGAIEQDADIVMFIDRSMNEVEAESENRPDLGMAKLIVAKHRNGATRDIDLAFNPEFTKFMDFVDESRYGGN